MFGILAFGLIATLCKNVYEKYRLKVIWNSDRSKNEILKALKAGAKAGGVSLADIRADIEATIDEAMNSPDPEVQAISKIFW